MANIRRIPAPLVFYIVAHPDDWIYFTSSIFYDVQKIGKSKNNLGKLVIVYLTSGDAGRTDGWWQAREEGAKAATRFLASMASIETSPQNALNGAADPSDATNVYRFGVTTSYFLRIPDGQVQCLLDGAAQETVDGVMRYRDQNDLYKRLANIIEAERNGDSALCINTLSDRQHPPTQENCDHIALGKAIKSMVQLPNVVPNFTCVFWHAYSNADKTVHPVVEPYQIYPTNIASNAHFGLLVWKAMALGAYSGKIQDMFPESNGVHLSSSCTEQAESVQWLSHMCIDYVYPEVANADEFYLGMPHSLRREIH